MSVIRPRQPGEKISQGGGRAWASDFQFSIILNTVTICLYVSTATTASGGMLQVVGTRLIAQNQLASRALDCTNQVHNAVQDLCVPNAWRVSVHRIPTAPIAIQA